MFRYGRGCKPTRWFVVVIITIVLLSHSYAIDSPIEKQIQQIGNENDDSRRVELLRALKSHPALPFAMHEQIDRLIQEFDRWNNDKRLDYFGGPIRKTLDWDFGVPPESPLYPLTHLYRARMIVWYALESGNVWRQPKVKNQFMIKAREELQSAHRAFPDNQIVRMYLGEPIPNSKQYVTPSNAPDWATYQREGLERLADIIEWWIDHREQENHEYGGGWGDDCEMWRWWVPVSIAFDDPKITSAQSRFSQALLDQDHLKPGYVTFMTDVEHSAEDLADALTPMMHLDPDNPEWSKKVFKLAEFMKTLWTGTNQRGFLQFKSTYFNAFEVLDDPAKACDTVYHPRTMQPALLYWQRSEDRGMTQLFSAWMDTWVDATARSERGKPAGIVPSAIHWPDGIVGGVGENWWDPRNHNEPTLYEWPSALDMMLNTMLLVYHKTGSESYLEPIRSMARIRREYLSKPPETEPVPGSKEWCAAKMNLSAILAKYRFLTGDREFDDLLRREQAPYTRYRLWNEEDALMTALNDNATALWVNFEGYTSEVRYTDRVLRFPTLFGDGALSPNPENHMKTPNPQLLYSTCTGDPGDIGYFPMNRVRWLTPPRQIAALVKEAGDNRFEAELYHFGESTRPMKAEIYLLAAGKYQFQLISVHENEIVLAQSDEIFVDDSKAQISFALPSRMPCTLRLTRR